MGCEGKKCSDYCEHVLQCASQYENQRVSGLECGFKCPDGFADTPEAFKCGDGGRYDYEPS
ncbi:hypothetical protein MHLP_02530 [Candidatus Mycoplasma haematolamae str. Purdue]|uniref:Uncharacterized protein n=1 Tax=Mycoplasma haematolamae (strain Purdue) TaxID=1212765 RepID=I7CFT9_MYCHA|nr:hypothetical protein [Candidatus Mycoplasma haematolamae]AFO52086.1 hypothetical protein MHLP_02530 [Candidatus Mycoplasma haematolamae str. Purdue]